MPTDQGPGEPGSGAECAANPEATLQATPSGPPPAAGAAEAAAPMPSREEGDRQELCRGAVVGRYIVLDRVGAGGMAVVYAAYDPKLDRKVALKLVRPDTAGSSSNTDPRGRLLREAQALARLSHPNVVAVYDAGTVGSEVFLAMEFVEGKSLDLWLDEAKRSWQQVVEVFRAAGAGLAAAHKAGLIHRDFKPQNVLMGDDGRVRVADFGLARPHEGAGPAERARVRVQDSETLPASDERFLSMKLTLPGDILGTPAYMSLEQFLGEPTDARTDIFSFCAAFYEAVYGHRPFEGTSLLALTKSIAQGKLRAAPADSPVPKWLRSLLERGLRASPEDRYPTMDALLAELGRERGLRVRRWLLAGAGIVAAAVALSLGVGSAVRRGQVCSGAQRHWDGVWDPEQRSSVKAAFLQTGLPFAQGAFEGADAVFSAYRQSWVTAHREACEATRVRGEQSEGMLDRRMACLDERLSSARALTRVLARSDRDAVKNAVRAAQSLPPVADCANLSGISEALAVPADKRDRVAMLRAQVAEADALMLAGKSADALGSVTGWVGEARGLDYPPILARAAWSQGRMRERLGDFAGAHESLAEAAWAAHVGRDDGLLADVATLQIDVAGSSLGRAEEGRTWAGLAEASIRKAGGGPLREGRLASSVGNLLCTEGRIEDAMDSYLRGAALITQAEGPDRLEATAAFATVGVMYDAFHQYELAIDPLDRHLAVARRVLGEAHPDLASPLAALGYAKAFTGHFEEGLALGERARLILERAYGLDHTGFRYVEMMRGHVLLSGRRDAEAMEAYQHGLRVCEAGLGRAASDCLELRYYIGCLQRVTGKLDEAEASHEEGARIAREAMGDHPMVSLAKLGLAQVYVLRGNHKGALETLMSTTQTTAKHHQKDSPHIAMASILVGEALLGMGRHEDAIKTFESAIELLEKKHVDVWEIARARFGLARTLRAMGGDAKRAEALARAAKAAFLLLGIRGAASAAVVDVWMASPVQRVTR
jgi:eukaryotic-like serine/threonine-protein kinase